MVILKYKKEDTNGSCLFETGSPTDIVGRQNFQTFSTRQLPHLGDSWGELTTTTTSTGTDLFNIVISSNREEHN